MSIADKITQLAAIKSDIKAAIIAKGQTVGDNMTEYAAAISNISSGPISPAFSVGSVAEGKTNASNWGDYWKMPPHDFTSGSTSGVWAQVTYSGTTYKTYSNYIYSDIIPSNIAYLSVVSVQTGLTWYVDDAIPGNSDGSKTLYMWFGSQGNILSSSSSKIIVPATEFSMVQDSTWAGTTADVSFNYFDSSLKYLFIIYGASSDWNTFKFKFLPLYTGDPEP